VIAYSWYTRMATISVVISSRRYSRTFSSAASPACHQREGQPSGQGWREPPGVTRFPITLNDYPPT